MRRSWENIKRSTWIRADELRLDQTLSERLLWRRIRASQLGVRFRRQHPIEPYIVDFCCPKENLIIEIDGESHFEAMQLNMMRDAQVFLRLQAGKCFDIQIGTCKKISTAFYRTF